MGKRARQRRRDGAQEAAPTLPPSRYDGDDGAALELRAVFRPAARRRYTETLHGGLNREDAWQRGTELLLESLAVSWTVNGVVTSRQDELLARYRVASPDERRFVRDTLRAHLAEHFPELEAP